MTRHRYARAVAVGALLVFLISAAHSAFCQQTDKAPVHQNSNAVDNGQSHFVSLGNVRLQYVDWGGRGETLIFIPGGCDTAFVFGDTASRLAQHFRVLGLTARGCGASDRPVHGYDMQHQVEDILDFLNALKIDRCTLIGHSLGGGKITQFALTHPERVNRLVYLDTVYAYVAPGLEEGMNKAVEKILGGHPMDSLANWKQSAKVWEPGAQSAAMDRDFSESFVIQPDGKIRERFETPTAWRKEVDRDVQAGLYTATHIEKPALMIFAMDTDRDRASHLPAEVRNALTPLINQTDEHRRQEILRFQRSGNNVHIVELRQTSHYCFVQRPVTVSRLITTYLMSRPAE